MVRINSFVDREKGLQGPFPGSVQILNRSIVEANIAVHGLGSNVQGTFTLARGRLTGSLGTERLPRQIQGRGTVSGQLGSYSAYLNLAPSLSLPNVSGTLPIATKTSGTLALPRFPRQITGRGTITGAIGSFGTYNNLNKWTGTIQSARIGSHGATKIWAGTLAAARTQTLPNIPGTTSIATKTLGTLVFSRTSGTLPINSRASGTLALQRLPRQLTGFGTIAGAVGSFTKVIETVGTFTRSTLSTGSPIQAPARWRHLSWQVRLANTSTARSGMAIIQSRANNGGTIAKSLIAAALSIPAFDMNLGGMISPYLGSYNLRRIGSNGTFLGGQEWTN